jgi:hypothetical protein
MFLSILQEVGCEGTDWTYLSQDRVKWRAFVDAVMDVRIL